MSLGTLSDSITIPFVTQFAQAFVKNDVAMLTEYLADDAKGVMSSGGCCRTIEKIESKQDILDVCTKLFFSSTKDFLPGSYSHTDDLHHITVRYDVTMLDFAKRYNLKSNSQTEDEMAQQICHLDKEFSLRIRQCEDGKLQVHYVFIE